MSRALRLFRAPVLTFALLFAPLVSAQVVVFSWSGSGDWSEPVHWTPTGVPGLMDSAVIASGSAMVSDNRQIGALQFTGGILTGGGTLTLNNPGSTWSGGTLSGTGTLKLAPSATLDLSGPNAKVFNRGDGVASGGRTIENLGLITWSGTGSLIGGDGARILNQAGATFDLRTDATLVHGGGAPFGFTNAGTFKKTAGTGVFTVAQTDFTNTGSVEAHSGTIAFTSGVTSNGGTFSADNGAAILFSGGQTFTGTTFIGLGGIRVEGGTTTIAGQLTAQNLTLAGGTLQGTATLSGNLGWIAGTWSGAGTLTIDGSSQLTISGAADKLFNRGDSVATGGRTIENFGAITWTGAGRLLGGDGAHLLNRISGVVSIRNDSLFGHTGAGSVPAFTNEGLIRKEASLGTSTISSSTFVNASGGRVEVLAGTLAFTSSVTSHGGSFTAAPGACLTFSGPKTFNHLTALNGQAGNIRITGGDTIVSGNLTAFGVEFAGGNLHGSAALIGTLNWTGGNFAGNATLTIPQGSTLLATGAGDRVISRGDGSPSGGRILENFGTITAANSGSLLGNDGAQWINRSGGLFTLDGDVSIAHGGNGVAPSFTNQGTFLKTSGTGTSTVSVPFNSTGALGVFSGTLAFTSTFSHTGASIVLANGSTLSVASALNLGNASLAGTGTISAPSIAAGGVVVPGNSAGTLAVAGNLTLLSTSLLLIELGGTVPGSGYDVLAVSGTAALAGNLHVGLLNNFSPGTADTFTILTSAGLTGNFANIANGQRLDVPGAGSFLVNYGASPFATTSVILSNFQPIPEPSTYALLGLGALAILVAVRRRK